jgi:hypothetical protein
MKIHHSHHKSWLLDKVVINFSWNVPTEDVNDSVPVQTGNREVPYSNLDRVISHIDRGFIRPSLVQPCEYLEREIQLLNWSRTPCLLRAARRLPNAAARVRSKVKSYGTKRHCGRFSASTSIPPANSHSTSCSTLRGWYNQPNSGRRTKWTVPTPQKSNIYIYTSNGTWWAILWNSVTRTTYRRMVGWLINNELERIFKEAVMA